VPGGASGYCECVQGHNQPASAARAASVNCNHAKFVCSEMCALPLNSSKRTGGGTKSVPIFAYKPLVMLMSSLDKVIFLDTDNIMFASPSKMFELMDQWHSEDDSSAIFWPDLWTFDNDKRAALWEAVGGPIQHGSHQESGMVLICKSCGGFVPLALALFFNVYYPKYYQALYAGTFGEGDKDTFQLGWHAMKEPYRMMPRAGLTGAMKTKSGEMFGVALAHVGPSVAGKTPPTSPTEVVKIEAPSADDIGFLHHNGIKWKVCELLRPPPWVVVQYHSGPSYSSEDDVEIVGDVEVTFQCTSMILKHPTRYSLLTTVQVFPRDKFEYARQAMLHVYMALKGHEICTDGGGGHATTPLPTCAEIVGGRLKQPKITSQTHVSSDTRPTSMAMEARQKHAEAARFRKEHPTSMAMEARKKYTKATEAGDDSAEAMYMAKEMEAISH